MKKITGLSLSLLAAFALTSCSDDSSDPATAPAGDVPASSETAVTPTSSEALPASSADMGNADTPIVDLSSSSEIGDGSIGGETASSSSQSVEVPCTDPEPVTLVADTNGFYDIGDVYKSIKCNEKAVFVVRHAEREPYITQESPLTEDGVLQAQSVGAKMIGGEDFVFSHTDFVRTESTCLNVALGRGQTSFVHDTNDVYQASWYVLDSEKRTAYNQAEGYSSNKVIAEWAFTGAFSDAFYDFNTRNEEMVNTYLASSYEAMPKYRMVCSHDEFVVPLVTYLTDAAINYRVYDVTIVPKPRWANYLSGAALIQSSEGERRVYPIKGLDNGFE